MAKGFVHESTHNESKEWYTPKYIFDGLGGILFSMDVASPGKDVVPWIPAERHLTIWDDGLTAKWEGCVFVNPPYGSDTPQWMRRLRKHENGIALVFARTDTKWFQETVPDADIVCFIAGRVGFVAANKIEDYIASGCKTKFGGCGAASMLVGYGITAYETIIDSNLGLCFCPADVSDTP